MLEPSLCNFAVAVDSTAFLDATDLAYHLEARLPLWPANMPAPSSSSSSRISFSWCSKNLDWPKKINVLQNYKTRDISRDLF